MSRRVMYIAIHSATVTTAIYNRFNVIDPSTVDNSACLRHGHAPGGVAIMWRAALDKNITPLDFDVNWLTGIRLQHGSQVYPYY